MDHNHFHSDFKLTGCIWRSGDRASWWILIIKPTRCTNFSNLFLEWNSTRFRQFLYPSSGVFHWTHSNGTCYTGLLTACEQDQGGTGTVPPWSCLQAVWELTTTLILQ